LSVRTANQRIDRAFRAAEQQRRYGHLTHLTGKILVDASKTAAPGG
jgi:hypothetical protein